MYSKIELTTEAGETKAVEMMANAATVIRYKAIFHEDLQKSITKVLSNLYGSNAKTDEEGLEVYGDIDTEVISKLAYVMNKQAEDGIKKASLEDYINWLEGFEPMAFISSAGSIIALYFGQKVGTSNPKKADAQQIES